MGQWSPTSFGNSFTQVRILSSRPFGGLDTGQFWSNSGSSCSVKTAIYSEKFYIFQLFGVDMESKPVKVQGRPAKTDAHLHGLGASPMLSSNL